MVAEWSLAGGVRRGGGGVHVGGKVKEERLAEGEVEEGSLAEVKVGERSLAEGGRR